MPSAPVQPLCPRSLLKVVQKQNDIAALFQQFGGAPDTYREITRQEQSQEARARWPLQSQIDGARTDAVPPVQAHERLPTAGVRQQALPAPVTPSRAPSVPQGTYAAPARQAPAMPVAPVNPLLFLGAQAAAAPVAPLQSLRDARGAFPRTEPAWTAAPTTVQDPVAPVTPKAAPGTASPLSRLGHRTAAAPLPVPEKTPVTTDLLQDIFGQLARPSARGPGT